MDLVGGRKSQSQSFSDVIDSMRESLFRENRVGGIDPHICYLLVHESVQYNTLTNS